MWDELGGVGRDGRTGGYRRFAWTTEDLALREWFTGQAQARGLDLTTDRAGNLWAWTSDPDAAVAAGRPGLVLGSHLDSVPDGGAFDGPLGVVSAFAALDLLRENGFEPSRPIGIACFGDEEGARFGIACAGSRLVTGVLDADRARGLVDADGTSMAEAMAAGGFDAAHLGRDDETLRRVGTFVELHVEQGRALVDQDAPVGVASAIWPHGRWRFDLARPRRPRRHHPARGPRRPDAAAGDGDHHGALVRRASTAPSPPWARCGWSPTASTRSRRPSPPGWTPAAPTPTPCAAVVAEVGLGGRGGAGRGVVDGLDRLRRRPARPAGGRAR